MYLPCSAWGCQKPYLLPLLYESAVSTRLALKLARSNPHPSCVSFSPAKQEILEAFRNKRNTVRGYCNMTCCQRLGELQECLLYCTSHKRLGQKQSLFLISYYFVQQLNLATKSWVVLAIHRVTAVGTWKCGNQRMHQAAPGFAGTWLEGFRAEAPNSVILDVLPKSWGCCPVV